MPAAVATPRSAPAFSPTAKLVSPPALQSNAIARAYAPTRTGGGRGRRAADCSGSWPTDLRRVEGRDDEGLGLEVQTPVRAAMGVERGRDLIGPDWRLPPKATAGTMLPTSLLPGRVWLRSVPETEGMSFRGVAAGLLAPPVRVPATTRPATHPCR